VAAFCNKCHLHSSKVGEGLADGRAFSAHISLLTPAWSAFMGSSHMPPIPPANRTKKGPGSDPAASKDEPLKQPEHHHNAAEEGETANIKQNTTNKGFFRGRRQD
jgi:hypothetical protein